MNALPAGRHRRGAGDDLQRVRPGPRDREPRHRRALPAGGLQRHQLNEDTARRHAPGRHLGRHRTARSDEAYADTAGDVHQGLDQGLGLRRGTTRRTAADIGHRGRVPARARATSCG